MRILSVPLPRAGYAVMLVVSAALVLPASAAAQSNQGLPACKGLSEQMLNRWIGQANSGQDVSQSLGRGRACEIAVGAKGLTPLTGKLTLTATPGSVVLRGGAPIFDVRDRGVLSITGLTLTGSTNAAVRNNTGGRVTITKSKIVGNSAYFGGGLANAGGTMSVHDSEITGNTASGNSGGLGNSGVTATMTVSNSKVTGNKAMFGGGMANNTGTVLVINTLLSKNTADSGGAYVNSAGNVTIIGSDVVDNSSPDGGGLVTTGTLNVIKTRISRNTGGGLASQGGGTVLVTDSQVTDNTFTGAGAGLINAGGGLMTVTNSTVSGNKSDAVGGGIDNHFGGTTRVINSTITGNTATNGGGLNNAAGGLLVSTNTTVKSNTPNNCAGQIEGCP